MSYLNYLAIILLVVATSTTALPNDILKLNQTAPRFVKIASRIESYVNSSVVADAIIIEPRISFVQTFLLPARYALVVSDVRTFVNNELSYEFNGLVTQLERYTASICISEDLDKIARFIETYGRNHAAAEYEFIKTILLDYVLVGTSNELTMLVTDIFNYIKNDFIGEMSNCSNINR